jgi:hypothetical protein
MAGCPVGEGDLSAGRSRVIDPNLSAPDNEDPIVMFTLIEHHFTLGHRKGAASSVDLGHLLGRETIEKMRADVQPFDGFAHEQRGVRAGTRLGGRRRSLFRGPIDLHNGAGPRHQWPGITLRSVFQGRHCRQFAPRFRE